MKNKFEEEIYSFTATNDKILIVGVVKSKWLLRQIADFKGVPAFRASLTHLRVWVLKGSLCNFASHNGERRKFLAVQERETSHRIKFTTFKFWSTAFIVCGHVRISFRRCSSKKSPFYDRRSEINLSCWTFNFFEERKLLTVEELCI